MHNDRRRLTVVRGLIALCGILALAAFQQSPATAAADRPAIPVDGSILPFPPAPSGLDAGADDAGFHLQEARRT